MHNYWYYLSEYIETNQYTLYLTLFLIGISLIAKFTKGIPWPTSNKALWLTIAAGIGLRCMWLMYSSHTSLMEWQTWATDFDYINIHALDMKQGKWFLDAMGEPIARRPIGYPLFLGLVYALFGPHITVAWMANMVLFVVGALFLYKITALISNKQIAWLTMVGYSIFPMSIYSIKMTTDEHLFMPVWLASIYFLLCMLNNKAMRAAWFWFGLTAAYATMIRTHAIFMPLLAGIMFVIIRKPWKQVIGILLSSIVILLCISAPWIMRNQRVFDTPILFGATSCFVYTQVNSSAQPEGLGHIPLPGEEGYSLEVDQAIKSGNSGKAHQACGRAMQKWIVSHPAQFVDMGLKRLLLFMRWDRQGVWATWHQFSDKSFDPARPVSAAMKEIFEELYYIYYYMLFFMSVFAVMALFVHRKSMTKPKIINLLVIFGSFFFWFCEHMVIYPDRKYRFPLEILMIMPACWIIYLWSRPRKTA